MKLKNKFLLFLGLGSLFVGLILITLGLASGGTAAIKKISGLHQNTVRFDNVTDIQLDSQQNVTIQTGDVDKVTVTYYTDNDSLNQVTTSQKNGQLTIKGNTHGFAVRGVMKAFSYLLNEAENHDKLEQISITVPEGTKLNSLNNTATDDDRPANLTVTNLTIDSMTAGSNVTLKKSTINSGSLSGSYNDFEQSTLKHISLSNDEGTLEITQSTLEDANISSNEQDITISKSTIKNTAIANSTNLSTSDSNSNRTYYSNSYEEDSDVSDFEDNLISIDNSSLENVAYSGTGSLDFNNVSLIGDNRFAGDSLDVTITLADSSKKQTNLQLSTQDGSISLASEFPNAQTISQNDKNFQSKLDNSNSTLTISNTYGDIDIK